MRLSNLPTLGLGLASILCNALHSHARGHQFLRGGDLPIPELPSPEKLVGTNWQLKEISGVPAIPDPQELFFKTETAVSGYDGCNWFFGAWSTVESDQDSQTSDRPSITIGRLVSTLMGCSLRDEAAEQQRIFMSALRQEAISFSLSADEKELTLYHTLDEKNLSIVLSSIPIPVQPNERLIGTDWVATGIVYPDSQNELRPVLEDHPVTLSFSKDELDGSTGTNQFFADVPKMTSMEFQVANVYQTLMGWGENDDPRTLQEQEDAWLSILYFGRSVDRNDETQIPPEVITLPYALFEERIEGTDEMTQVLVLGSYQKPLARFVPQKEKLAPAFELHHETIQLAGSNWKATNIRGSLLNDDPASQLNDDITVFFTSETSVKGHGGCNQFHASWEEFESIQMNGAEHPLILRPMQIKDLAHTRAHCDSTRMQVEEHFFGGLTQELLFYDFDGEEITLWDAEMSEDGHQSRGNLIGQFINVPVPNWGGQSLIGMKAEEAKAAIETINPSLQVQNIPEGSLMTDDHRLDRVRIFVEEGNVAREPQRG